MSLFSKRQTFEESILESKIIKRCYQCAADVSCDPPYLFKHGSEFILVCEEHFKIFSTDRRERIEHIVDEAWWVNR